MSFEGIRHKADENFLRDEYQRYLTALSGFLPLPDEVVFVFDPDHGPQYNSGAGISGRFPYFTRSAKGRILTKASALSLALPLHELTHQILESYILATYQTSRPPVVWAFYTNIDMMHEVSSRENIENGKVAAGLGEISTDQLMDQFFGLTVESTQFNEFLADVLPMLFLSDPDAIYKNAAFPGDAESERLVHWRRYGQPLTPATFKQVSENASEYQSTVPAKIFVWREIHARMADGRIKAPFGEVAARIVQQAVATFLQLTNDLKSGRIQLEKQMPKLNRALIGNLCREFAISPCQDAVLGAIDSSPAAAAQ